MTDTVDGLKLLRKPFEPHQISKMCKPTKRDNQPGRCKDCNGWHKLPSVQLSYVGHAALTDRLLDADPQWTWEPLALNQTGTPLLDGDGGMWIRLTVCGVTRLGYGDAQGKIGGDAMKERIGDALRNAAMRFGAALDLWHKGDLHGSDDEDVKPERVVIAEEKFNERTGQGKAGEVLIRAFWSAFKGSGKTDAQLATILRTRYSTDSVENLTASELSELVSWSVGKEPIEATLKTSVEAATKPQERQLDTSVSQSPRKPGSGPTEPQLKRLYAISKAHNVSEADIKQFIKENYGVESTKDLSRDQYNGLCNFMETQQ